MELEKNGVCWELVDDFESLLDPVLADAGTAVKDTPTKLVTAHRLNGQSIYVKRYKNAVGLRPLKYYWKESEARNEWKLAAIVTARGVPVVRYLAFGERWTSFGLQESIIISEGFEGERLDHYARKDTDELQVALAQLLRLMHDQGVLQRDLHHNILVKEHPLELCRIDVDRGEMKGSLPDSDRIENLAYINVFVPLLPKFFETYGVTAEFVESIERRSRVIRRQLAERRGARCLQHNLRFAPRKFGSLKWWVRLEYLDTNLERVLTDPDGCLESSVRSFKSGPNRQSTVGACSGVVLKRFNQKNHWNYFKDIFRPSRAYRAYRNAYHLELLEVLTPRPIAAAERRICGRILVNSYMVTEEIAGAKDLGTLPHISLALARAAGRVIGQLHAAGFTHGDLKETNLVTDEAGNVYLLDLDGLRYLKTIPDDCAVADLQRLARGAAKYPAVTPAHRRAFLRAYCGVRNLRRVPRSRAA